MTPADQAHAPRIVQGDCIEAMRDMPAASVDACVTSPPYNIGVRYSNHDDRMSRHAYLSWMDAVGAEVARLLKPDGSLFLVLGNTGPDPWIASDVAREYARSLTLQNPIAWVKSATVGGNTIGHFKPKRGQAYLNNTYETVYHFTKGGRTAIDRLAIGVPFKDKSNIARWGHAADRRCAGNVWVIPYETVRSKAQKFHHPAGFPLALADRCIAMAGRPGGLVLDPFMGAGTTLLAATLRGCASIGIDKSPEYCAAARERLEAQAAG